MPLPLSYRNEGEHLHYNGNYHERRRASGADVDIFWREDCRYAADVILNRVRWRPTYFGARPGNTATTSFQSPGETSLA